MKKIFPLITLFVILLSLNVFAQFKAFPNPSVAYIDKMGCSYQLQKDAIGNETGMVIFPDGTKSDAWAFLKGKTGREFSYCAKKGYSTTTKSIDHGSWTEEIAVCSKTGKNGVITKIPMLDLMEKNGEPLISNTDRPRNDNPPAEKTNPDSDSPATFPASFDWRNFNGHSYTGPVRNQGNCGSCYSFGALSNAEGVYNVAMGKFDANCIDLSESFIIWCLARVYPYSQHFNGCVGADYTYYELQALVDSGTTYESNFPYTVTDPGSCTHWSDPRLKFTNWYRVPCSDIDGIKTAIMNYGAVDAAVYVTSNFSNYTGGVYSDGNTACSSSTCYYTPTNHAIALVGWGVDPVSGEYWILRNSWGASWGESGYMKIAMTSARVSCEVAYLTYLPPQAPPLALTSDATGITAAGATLNGAVSAQGPVTNVVLEYGLTTSYGNTINATPGTVNGFAFTSETSAVTGLTVNTQYHVRVKAENALGTTYGNDITFTTAQLPPAVITNAATNITTNSATLNGLVIANNLSTTVTYEYGLTTSYGSCVNATPYTVAGTSGTTVTAGITSLANNTLFHFRVKAVNAMGTTYGNDLTFTTLPVTCTDIYEPNNTQSQATTITLATNMSGLISAINDIDWFKFSNTSSAKNIKVELSNLPADYDVKLYSGGKVVASSENRGTTSELIKYNNAKVGTYNVNVYGYNGAYNTVSCYTLKVSISGTSYKSTDTEEGTTVNEQLLSKLNIYPNPTSGQVTMDYDATTAGKIVIRVLNLTGSKVMESTLVVAEGVNSFTINIADQANGLYFLELTSDNDHILRKIMLKN